MCLLIIFLCDLYSFKRVCIHILMYLSLIYRHLKRAGEMRIPRRIGVSGFPLMYTYSYIYIYIYI